MSATSTSALATVVPIALGVTVAASGRGDATRTAVSGVLMWGGALAGPAVGYMAEGQGGLARDGVLLRSAIFAIAWAVAPTTDFDDGFVPNPQLDDVGAWLLAVPAIALSATYDIVVANRRVRAARTRVGVLPMRTRDGTGVAVVISR